MKPLKDLQEISRMLAASPSLPAPSGSAATVQSDVFLNRLEQLLEVGMGLPLAHFVDSKGVYLKLYFSRISEFATVYVPTNRGSEFLKEVKVKIVAAI